MICDPPIRLVFPDAVDFHMIRSVIVVLWNASPSTCHDFSLYSSLVAESVVMFVSSSYITLGML
jgi:hypothetical protein